MCSTLSGSLALLLALPSPGLWLGPAAPAEPEATAPEAETPEPDASEPEAETPEEPAAETEGEPAAETDGEVGEPEPTPEAEVPEPEPEPVPPPEELDEEMLDEELLDEEPPRDDYDPMRDSPEAIEARRMITGGIILLTTGTALAIGSLAMGVSDKCNRAAGNSCSGASRNRAAATMAVPAVGIFAAGAVLLGIGMRNRNRVKASVAWSREGGGVLFTGRF
jgi:hypothetical protein